MGYSRKQLTQGRQHEPAVSEWWDPVHGDSLGPLGSPQVGVAGERAREAGHTAVNRPLPRRGQRPQFTYIAPPHGSIRNLREGLAREAGQECGRAEGWKQVPGVQPALRPPSFLSRESCLAVLCMFELRGTPLHTHTCSPPGAPGLQRIHLQVKSLFSSVRIFMLIQTKHNQPTNQNQNLPTPQVSPNLLLINSLNNNVKNLY